VHDIHYTGPGQFKSAAPLMTQTSKQPKVRQTSRRPRLLGDNEERSGKLQTFAPTSHEMIRVSLSTGDYLVPAKHRDRLAELSGQAIAITRCKDDRHYIRPLIGAAWR
jgi:hypothetical protein